MSNSRDILQTARRVVVKVGSTLLTKAGTGIDGAFVTKLSGELAALKKRGYEPVLVTSGAVAAGVEVLKKGRPQSIPAKQANAAVGQSRLMHAYEEAFGRSGVLAAQVLLTHGDLADRRRYLNARGTFSALFDYGVVPIVNENDTVTVDELKVGDNDNLSAHVASLVEADVLVLLTDIDGLYDADPRLGTDATRLEYVARVDEAIRSLAGGAGSRAGTGGMITKIEAAEKATAVGIPVIVAGGWEEDVLRKALSGEIVGTFFAPASDRIAARKHWIAFTLKPQGRLWVDDGACAALQESGRSLLPSGIRQVEGDFVRGEAVSICDPAGNEFARGIVEYSAAEVRQLAGRKSGEIESILGFKYLDEVIHRDDMVVLR